jgi:ribosomal protein L18
MSVKFSNNGHSTLAASLTSSATSITVASGHGARFPSLSSGEYFYATLIDASNNLEIVKVTARSSDVLTATRAQESTTARAYAIGDRIELRITAQGLTDATDILPSQSGNSGKFLKTDGSALSFADVPAGNDASALSTGTLDSDRLAAGCIRQVLQWGDTSRYLINSPSGFTAISSVLSNGTPAITCADNNNKILAQANFCFGQVDTWSAHGFIMQYKIGSGSWTNASGAQATTYISGRSGGGNTSGQIHLLDLTTTSTVYFRCLFEAQDSGDYVRINYGAIDNNGDNRSDYAQRSTITLMEVVV